MRKRIKVITLFLAAIMLFSISACKDGNPENTGSGSSIDRDRAGNHITLPDKIEKIISLGPSNTEILIELGAGDKIIAADEYSAGIPGLKDDIPLFSMMSPDGEKIISLEPDVIFVTGMSMASGDDPFKSVADAGICVIYIPSSESVAAIKEDIRYLAEVMGDAPTGEEIVSVMEEEISRVKEIGDAITDKKAVYFEIAAAPYMTSFGKGVFLDELIEIIGARNILEGQESWISISDETVLDANPDVILTSVNYIDDPTGEISARPGWDSITAVQNGDVYYIDADASNRPSHNIVKALKAMAEAVYPENY